MLEGLPLGFEVAYLGLSGLQLQLQTPQVVLCRSIPEGECASRSRLVDQARHSRISSRERGHVC